VFALAVTIGWLFRKASGFNYDENRTAAEVMDMNYMARAMKYLFIIFVGILKII